MNIKDIINKLFKINKNDIKYVAAYGDLIEFPTRVSLNSDDEIDKIKEIYRNILVQDKTITSNELHLKEFQDEITMNLELLMTISLKDIDLDVDSEIVINNLTSYSKLQLYLESIMKLEKEIKCSVVALKELENRSARIKYFINRRSSIKEEINNLLGILVILNNQKTAIYHKVDACFTLYKTNVDKLSKKDKDLYLEKRYKKLKHYIDVLEIPDESINYNNMFLKIAALEKSLEIYVYNNQDKIALMRDKLNGNVQETDIDKLECFFRTLDEFGKNNITDEDLATLYRLKFEFKVKDIYTSEKNPFLDLDDDNRDFLEYMEYGQIVSEMLEDILNDKDNIVSSQFDTKEEDFWFKFNHFIKNFDSYDIDYILTNKLVLAFILSIHNSAVKAFFENYLIDTTQCVKSYDKNLFALEDRVPLKTIFELFSSEELFNLASFLNEGVFRNNNLTITYLNGLYINNKKTYDDDKDTYYIPEGIINLSMNTEPEYYFCEANKLIENIILNGFEKNIYTPTSLKECSTETFFFPYSAIRKLVLNEGLENIHFFRFYMKVKELIIPSTLKKLTSFHIDYEYLDSITFNNVKESMILNDDLSLCLFLEGIIKNLYYPKAQHPGNFPTYFKYSVKNIFFCNIKRITFIDDDNIYYFDKEIIIDIIDKAIESYIRHYIKENSDSLKKYNKLGHENNFNFQDDNDYYNYIFFNYDWKMENDLYKLMGCEFKRRLGILMDIDVTEIKDDTLTLNKMRKEYKNI